MRFLGKTALIAAVVAGLWSVPSLRAEDSGQADHHPGHHEMGGKMWKEKFGLSDDQAAKLKSAMKAHWEAAKPLHEQMKQAMEKLHAQITLKYSDSDIQATLDELTKTHKAMAAQREKFMADLKSFLTPTQRAKLMLSMMKHMHGHGSWMEHRGHHDGFGRDDGDGHFGGASDMRDAPDSDEGGSEEMTQDSQN